jgi:hypothetical protein
VGPASSAILKMSGGRAAVGLIAIATSYVGIAM